MGNARKAALTALEKCRRMDAWSDAVLGSVMDSERLSGPDRGLAAALCYGVMQNRMLLDALISRFSTVPLSKIEPKVLDILRISAYQLVFLDRIPASAAVNEAVKLCKAQSAGRAAGFVNAVLRKISAGDRTLPEGNGAEALSLRFSHPLWLVRLYLERLGPDETEQLLRSQNGVTPACLQVNSLRSDADALTEKLQSRGLSPTRHPFLPDCLLLAHPGTITEIPEFSDGIFYVQDAAAKLAVLAAEPKPGQRILDCCAAPGGKSFAAAILSGGAAILSCDLHENKLKRIRDGAERLRLDCISTRAMDARFFAPELEEQFDLVLADVPCSGLGVIRKKPDIRDKDPERFADLPGIQTAILENVSRYVAPGGTLLYSTCTVRREENEAVASAFLAAHPDFSAEDYVLPGGLESSGGMLQLWPHCHGTDGFFICKMRKQH